MDFIKAKNEASAMDVIFDGRFIFIEKFHGLVAVAQPIYDDDYNLIGYHVERTLAISPRTIKRVALNYLNDLRDRACPDLGHYKLEFEDCTVHQVVGSLPYGIELNLTK